MAFDVNAIRLPSGCQVATPADSTARYSSNLISGVISILEENYVWSISLSRNKFEEPQTVHDQICSTLFIKFSNELILSQVATTLSWKVKGMRKRSMGICFVILLATAIVVGGLYVLLTAEEIVAYDKTLEISEDTYPSAVNISIYYDVCFHNVSFNVVDDPGFMIKINWKLTVLVEGAKGKNTNLQVTNTSYGNHVTIQILKENPADICALNKGDARATVNVTINNAYTIDLEASAGHGNMNLTASNATFDNINFHHGINCPGNNGMNITDSVVYGDLICKVDTGHFWVRLDNVDVRGEVECTPPERGTLIVI
ncbi:MAG: hypothetical protein ThorAB25_16100 [Candidatus Thorarchaeota archaeon AB_25]|nr:MAG: hypothetical protein ThorAB25_16100 [Candidatus Thorarchaeota archaeon AB_25]